MAQGLQPLWGNHYGRQDTNGLVVIYRYGIAVNGVLSLLVFLLLLLFDEPVIRIFNQDANLVQAVSQALPVFSLSFIPMALNLICTAFLYSTKHTVQSDAIAFSRGIIAKSAAIFLIPMLLGDTYIWTAPFVAEGLTLVLAFVLKKASRTIYPAKQPVPAGKEC